MFMRFVLALVVAVVVMQAGSFLWFEVIQHTLAVAPDSHVQDWSMFLFHLLIMIYFPLLTGFLSLLGARSVIAFGLTVPLVSAFLYGAGNYMSGTRMADEAFWPGPTEQAAFALLTIGAVVFGLLFRRSNSDARD